MNQAVGSTREGQLHNVVTTDNKGVVVTVFRGRQTGETIRELTVELQKHYDALRAQGKKVLTLSDFRQSKLSDSTSEARVESKKMLSLHADAAAVVGPRGLLSVAMYWVRVVRPGTNVRFFSSERKARVWLEGLNHPKMQTPRPSVSLVAGIFVGLIAIGALAGHFGHLPYLLQGVPSFKPIQPIAAVGLLAAAYGFICYWLGNIKQLKLAGIFGMLLGVSALASLHIGHGAVLGSAEWSDSAALCFIAIGVSPFTVGTKKWIVRMGQYGLGTLIIGLSLLNIFGQLYAHDFIYGLSDSFVMAFDLAVAFFIVGATLVLIVLFRRFGNVLNGVTRIGWLVVAALVFVQVAAYGAWSQSVSRNKANASDAFLSRAEDLHAGLLQRIQAYNNALYGFKGLFVSSDYVDQGEFQSYYDSLNLSTTYPGLRALTFISKVQEKDLPAFVAKHRSDTSVHASGNPTFAITAKSSSLTHYIVTYNATAGTVGGSDLGSNPVRLAAFQKAEALGTPVSSGTVAFAANGTTPAQNGFFLTIPVVSKGGSSPVGFVNAVFAYPEFFAHAFMPKTLLKGIAVSITDPADNTTIYAWTPEVKAKDASFVHKISLPVADHMWQMRVSAPTTFGISESQRALPRTILIGGQLFSVLLIVIFILQTRARRQGFELADSITEDLALERNKAVANDQKSTAILASIGDAVFAVDTNKKITLFNPSAQQITGYSAGEVLGKPYNEVLKFELEKTGRVNDRFISEALDGRLTSMAKDTILIRKDGVHVPVADSAAPIRNAAQKIEGAIVVFRDITKDYELDRAKTEFVSLASHQLRTPLSAINWYGEMLLNGDAGKLNKSQHEYVTEIFEGNQRMVELVNALLNVSRLEIGKLTNKPTQVDVSEVIGSLEKEMEVGIQARHLTITRSLHALPKTIVDPNQLRMIIQNLMSNAIKYTPDKGAVHITLRRATAADMAVAKIAGTKPYWFFSVKDTGYGIPKVQQSKIFGKLFRADNVRKLDVEGTGLGLYIVKQVVEKLGGRVWFESIESVGTTVSVVLPLQDQKAKPHA